MGDESNTETLVFNVDKRKTNTINSDRTFTGHLGELGSGYAKPHFTPIVIILAGINDSEAIDVTGNVVPANGIACSERWFEISFRARGECAKIGSQKGLLARLECEAITLNSNRCKAAAIDRDTIAELGGGSDMWLADRNANAGWLCSNIDDFRQSLD